MSDHVAKIMWQQFFVFFVRVEKWMDWTQKTGPDLKNNRGIVAI